MPQRVTPDLMEHPRIRHQAWWIAGIYAVTATLWIYFSDQALESLIADPERLLEWSVYKGIGFVTVTAVLLLVLMRRAFASIEEGYASVGEEERRRRAREQEAEAERHFSETMIESMPGILYLYDATGRFLRWNRNFEEVSGYSGEELAHMTPMDLFGTEDQPRLQARIAEVFERGESSIEAPFLSKDGTTTPYFFTGQRVDFGGQECLVGVGIDVSKRVEAEAALRQLNESLERKVGERTHELREALVRAEAADRTKSAFLAAMSHELRTPLNSIIGFTGIVLQELAGPLTEEQEKQLRMVQRSARHLLSLINDVLDISKIEAGQLEVHSEPFDLPEVIRRAAETVLPVADARGLTLDLRIAPEVGVIEGDARRVEQVLLNLLSNGLKFTELGGVTVTARCVEECVRIQVADTGIGIRPDDLETLFQPFRQIDTGLTRAHEGTGLGLTICRRLTDLMGGQVSVTSAWGRGSEFSVTLPLNGTG